MHIHTQAHIHIHTYKHTQVKHFEVKYLLEDTNAEKKME